MKKVKKILDITEDTLQYMYDSPIEVSLVNIHHSPVHTHSNSLELVMCLEGNVTICCNHEEVVLNKNEMFTIEYNDLHCIYSTCDNMTIVLHIDYTNLGGLRPLYLSCEDASCKSYQKEMLMHVKGKVLALTYRILNRSISSQEINKSATDLLKIFEDNFNWLNGFETYQNKNIEIDKRMKTVFNHCVTNYTDKISASALAKELHINESYFSQFFRKSTYGGFNKMLGFIRCYHAQQFLLNSEMTITEIASNTGFSDEKYFYKYFTYWWTKTPGQFRRWYKDYSHQEDSIEILSGSSNQTRFEKHMAAFFAEILT